ncbi:hypothetical protein [Deinococcus sp. PEB2-63]
MTGHARNAPAPGTERQTRTGETISPIGQACLAVQHPVRRWALHRAVTTGQVTSLDIAREFPAYNDGNGAITSALRPLLRHGLMQVQEARRGTGPHVYRTADLNALRDLRDFLTALLEVPHETHD